MLIINEKLLKERYEKDDRYFRAYDQYHPNFNKAIVTGKFYSKYDNLDLTLARKDLLEAIEIFKDKSPAQKYPWPVTENQRYGWFTALVELDREDRRFYAPKNKLPFLEQEMKIKRDKTMQKPKFTGIPFKL